MVRRGAPLVVAAVLAAGCGGVSARRSYTAVTRAAVAPALPGGVGTLAAGLLQGTTIRASPGGRVLARIGTRDQFGAPAVLAVVKVQPAWLGVMTPFAGNGRLGWIPRSAAWLERVAYSLRASLSSRTLTVLYDGRVLKRYAIAIGAAYAPTPTGRFAVTDRLTTGNPQGPYGCCILALSATAPHAIPGWTGGNRIAIHATTETQTIGAPDSHGCLRVTEAEAHWLLYHVRDGTQITISG